MFLEIDSCLDRAEQDMARFKLRTGPKVVERHVDEIRREPMLYQCDLTTAATIGGNMTGEFLSLLPPEFDQASIDSRTHMLMKGWYPCIPGWHHDDVPREREDGQPLYHRASYRTEHVMCLWNGDIAPTEFALGNAFFTMPQEGRVIYDEWHKEVERKLTEQTGKNVLKKWEAHSHELIFFNDRTWHRGTAAVENGWRFFMRATRYIDPKTGKTIKKPGGYANEQRWNAQVYLSAENAGW